MTAYPSKISRQYCRRPIHKGDEPLPECRGTCNMEVMTVRQRVSEHRARLRAAGLRPVQVWVPDVRAEGFVEQAKLQALAVAAADAVTDDQDFIEAVSSDWYE